METILGDILETVAENVIERFTRAEKKTALITGAHGMLGCDVSEAFGSSYKALRFSSGKLDITDEASVLSVICKAKPAVVVNCAAFTAVDLCEREIARANAVNGTGAGNIAKACDKAGAVMIHVSTDYVFDGEKGAPYYETDPVNPMSVYGSSKLMGEALVREALREHYIVRTQWLFGKNGANFASKMLELGKKGAPFKVVDDQTGCPTYTPDLARGMLKLLESGAPFGTYHITNAEPCTWFRFAIDVLKAAGVSCEISPCETKDFPRPAKRPRYSALAGEKYALAGNEPLRSYKDALSEFLHS